jgi:hypothetical protein
MKIFQTVSLAMLLFVASKALADNSYETMVELLEKSGTPFIENSPALVFNKLRELGDQTVKLEDIQNAVRCVITQGDSTAVGPTMACAALKDSLSGEVPYRLQAIQCPINPYGVCRDKEINPFIGAYFVFFKRTQLFDSLGRRAGCRLEMQVSHSKTSGAPRPGVRIFNDHTKHPIALVSFPDVPEAAAPFTTSLDCNQF